MSTRFLLSLGNLLVSLMLGAVALGVGLFYFPDAMLQLFRWAGTVRDTIVATSWAQRYEGPVRALVEERQIVYMGFVVASRCVVGLLAGLANWLLGRSQQTDLPR